MIGRVAETIEESSLHAWNVSEIQIVTSKVLSTSGRASRCILKVSIDKVHAKVRPQRSHVRKSRANSCVYPDTSRLLRRPKLYLPSHYWRDSRETLRLDIIYDERDYYEREREKKCSHVGILGFAFGNDVPFVTRATVFSVILVQSETLSLITMTKYAYKVYIRQK